MATCLRMGFPTAALADTSYATCPSFSTFQSDVQAISNGTITFVAPNCTLDATSTIFIQSSSNVTIDGNGLTLSGGTAGTPGDFALFEIETPNGSLTLDHVTVEYGADGIRWTGKPETTTVTLINSTVSGNSGIGISANGNATVTNSTISGNGSAGIVADGEGDATVTNSTVSGNGGDGINAGGNATVTNSTITGNATDGVSSDGPVTLTFSTITDNGGDGVNGADQAFLATILAGNGSNCSDFDIQTDAGYNISTDTSCFFTATGAQDDIDISDLHLGTLSDNGGPTPTIPLSVDSSAVDAIPTTIVDGQTYCIDADLNPISDPVTSAPITSDQRGITRPQRSGCDIGAFEVEATATTTTAASASVDDASIGFSLTATVTADAVVVNQGTFTFHIVDSGDNPIGSDVQSDTVTNGTASAIFIPTSLAPGSYTITASYHDPSGVFRDSSNTNTLTVTPGPPATLTLDPGDTSATTSGSVTETAMINDASGYPVADGTTVKWTVTGPTSSSASISHQDVITTNGQAILTYSNTTSGVDTVTAIAGTTPDSASNSASVTWAPGTANSATLAPGDDSATAGNSITETVTVKDSNGNLVADGTAVNWIISGPTSATASTSHMDTVTTNGQASLTYSNTTTGIDSVQVTAGTSPDTASDSASVTWTPDTPDQIVLDPGDTSATVGDGVTETATVKDQYGNLVADGTSVQWSITGLTSSTASVSTQDTTTTNGQATLTYTNTTSGVDTVAATAGTSPDTATNSATVTWASGLPDSLTLSPGDTSPIVGSFVTETATVKDQDGNTVADGTTVTFSVTGVNQTSGSSTTVDGQASFTYSGTLTGADTLTATATGGTTPSASAMITWTAPSSTPRASLAIVNPFSPQIDVVVQTGANGGITVGVFTYVSSAVHLSQVQLSALVVNGSQATLYGQALANGTPVTFRLDATQGRVFGTVRLRLSNGYDSGNQSELVRVTP